MKKYTNDELKEIYKARRTRLAAKMRECDTGACVFIDSEEHRDPAVPYYTNHPTDAVLIIFSDGYSVLIAWDENLAKQNAFYDKLVPYMRYKNEAKDAVKAILNACYTHGENSKVELPPYLTYPDYHQVAIVFVTRSHLVTNLRQHALLYLTNVLVCTCTFY